MKHFINYLKTMVLFYKLFHKMLKFAENASEFSLLLKENSVTIIGGCTLK